MENPKNVSQKTIVGLYEKINIISIDGNKEYTARIDTGATNSSIDIAIASSMKLGPVIGSKLVKNAHGSKLRPMIEVEIEICSRKIKQKFTLSDRAHMKYPVLIGQNILKQDFLIDPSKESCGTTETKKEKKSDDK